MVALGGRGNVITVDGTELSCRYALQALPEPYLAVDVSTNLIVMANDAAERLLGYTIAELTTMMPSALLDQAEAGRLALAYETVVPGTISRREWMALPRSGVPFPVLVTSVPIVMDGRVVIHLLVHDLSDQEPAAAQQTLLSLAHERLAATLDYEETLRAITALIVPRVADRCTIDLVDGSGQSTRVADSANVASTAPPAPVQQASSSEEEARHADELRNEAPGEAMTFALRAHGHEPGFITMYRRAPRTWDQDARSIATALTRRAAQAIDSALLWQTAQRELARRAAIHRVSRAFAESEPGSDRVMEVLLNEGMAILDGDHGGIALWDAPSQQLLQVYSTTGRSNGMTVGLYDSLSGEAARARRPVISNLYAQEYGRGTPAGRFGSQAGIAAPLLHEGRLLGVLSVGTRVEGRTFTQDDAEALELLAGMAASMFGTLERAQLHGVTLAARELAHRLNNDLALAVGTIDLLRSEETLSGELHQLVVDAAAGLQRVGEHMAQLQQLVRFQIRETPVGPALDLDGSTGPDMTPDLGGNDEPK